MSKIVIVGAGISGLALAYRLQQTCASAEITLLEQRDRPGGTVWTERRDGFQIEIGPNGFLDTKPTTLSLCKELNLAEQLLSASDLASKNRFLFLDNHLRKLPGSLVSFLFSDLLSWRGKLAILMERFRSPRRDGADESIDSFARRRAGREAAEILADALVTGIYAGDPTLLSIRATFPRLVEFETKYGSVMKGFAQAARQRRAESAAKGQPDQRPGKMWSLSPGLRLLIETIRDRLARPPLTGVNVKRVERASEGEKAGWIIRSEGNDRWPADAVILACPAYQQAAMVADLDHELAELVGAIPYNRVAVVALGYRAAEVPVSLDGFGFLAPQRTRRDLLGVQWCSSIFPNRAPSGYVLLRAMCGGWHRPEVVGWDDARLLEAVRAELRLAMHIQATPIFHQIVRWDRAIPQYHVGHLQRVAVIEQRVSRHPGLFLGGNAYHGVALNDCTEQAEVLAQRVATYLGENAGH